MAHNDKKPDDKCKGNYPLKNLCMTHKFSWATRNTNSTVSFCSHTNTLYIFNAYLSSFFNSLNWFRCKRKTGFDLLNESCTQAFSKKAMENKI